MQPLGFFAIFFPKNILGIIVLRLRGLTTLGPVEKSISNLYPFLLRLRDSLRHTDNRHAVQCQGVRSPLATP